LRYVKLNSFNWQTKPSEQNVFRDEIGWIRKLHRRTMADSLFGRILAKADVFYRHQQNDEPDLTEGDKRGILEDLMTTNKALFFLQRYGQYMDASDCVLFRDEGDPLIQWMMKKRRYLMLQKLKEKGTYFSDEKMREREPYLYDVMVGKFTSEKGWFFPFQGAVLWYSSH
ncbi:hypothetical protein COOONC_17288, partial [Cooperia oncophora]